LRRRNLGQHRGDHDGANAFHVTGFGINCGDFESYCAAGRPMAQLITRKEVAPR
jgi:hypothetical protein